MEQKYSFDISGKTCIITGAGGALCGTIAEGLATKGVNIIALDLNNDAVNATADRISSAGGNIYAKKCNVLDKEELESAYQFTLEKFGIPDFLINGAGGNHPDGSTGSEFYTEDSNIKSFPDLPYEGMMSTLNLNYFGTVLPTQIFSRGMLENKSGCIINFASVSAFTPLTKVVCYSSAKAAIANFTKWLAIHYSKFNVRVNAIAPGFMLTEQLKFLHIDNEGNFTERAKKVIAHTPAGRYGTGEELVGAIIWLLSDQASFTTGSVIPIDGGFSSYTI